MKGEGNPWGVSTCNTNSGFIAKIHKRKTRKVVRKKACAERRKVSLLKDVKIREQFFKCNQIS